jgi:hypothetical protein
VVVCSALAVQLYGLFQLGIGGQITEVRHSVGDAARDASQQLIALKNPTFSEDLMI